MSYLPKILEGLVKEDEIAAAAGRKAARAFLDRFYVNADPRSSEIITPGLTSHHNGHAHWFQYGCETYTGIESAQAVAGAAKQKSAANLIVWTKP